MPPMSKRVSKPTEKAAYLAKAAEVAKKKRRKDAAPIGNSLSNLGTASMLDQVLYVAPTKQLPQIEGDIPGLKGNGVNGEFGPPQSTVAPTSECDIIVGEPSHTQSEKGQENETEDVPTDMSMASVEKESGCIEMCGEDKELERVSLLHTPSQHVLHRGGCVIKGPVRSPINPHQFHPVQGIAEENLVHMTQNKSPADSIPSHVDLRSLSAINASTYAWGRDRKTANPVILEFIKVRGELLHSAFKPAMGNNSTVQGWRKVRKELVCRLIASGEGNNIPWFIGGGTTWQYYVHKQGWDKQEALNALEKHFCAAATEKWKSLQRTFRENHLVKVVDKEGVPVLDPQSGKPLTRKWRTGDAFDPSAVTWVYFDAMAPCMLRKGTYNPDPGVILETGKLFQHNTSSGKKHSDHTQHASTSSSFDDCIPSTKQLSRKTAHHPRDEVEEEEDLTHAKEQGDEHDGETAGGSVPCPRSRRKRSVADMRHEESLDTLKHLHEKVIATSKEFMNKISFTEKMRAEARTKAHEETLEEMREWDLLMLEYMAKGLSKEQIMEVIGKKPEYEATYEARLAARLKLIS